MMPILMSQWLEASSWTSLRRKYIASTRGEPEPKSKPRSKKVLMYMLQVGSSAASNGAREAFVLFQDAVLVNFFSRTAPTDGMLKWSKCRSKSHKFMNAVVTRIILISLFIQPVASFMK